MKAAIVMLGVGFCILFGVSVATQGTERIAGSLGKPQAAEGKATAPAPAYTATGTKGTSPSASGREAKSAPPVSEAPARAELVRDTGVNRVGNKLGELLQIAAHHGIRAFIAVIEALIG